MKKQKNGLLTIYSTGALICTMLFLLGGCGNKYDSVSVRNRTTWNMDDIIIEAPEGYFYQRHEKIRVDDNTITLTIYFSKEDDGGGW